MPIYNFGKNPTQQVIPQTGFQFGMQFRKPIVKPEVIIPEKKIPEFLGGGQFKGPSTLTPEELGPFKTDRNKLTQDMKNEVRGGSFAEKRAEVDHKIPIGLGGTNDEYNLQAMKDKKTISQSFLDFVTGKERAAGAYKPENRQEGKMIIELEAIEKYKKEEISLAEARAAVINWDNNPEVFLHKEVKKAPGDVLAGLFKKAKSAISFLQEDMPEKIKSGLKGVGKLAKTIQEGIFKSGATTAMTLLEPFTGVDTIRDDQLDPALREVKEFLFGKDPFMTLQARVEQAEPKVAEFGKKKDIEFIEKGAAPISLLGVAGIIALDFAGISGGKKELLKLLAKADKVGDIVNMLKKIGVQDDLVFDYSRAISKVNKVDDVAKIINRIEEVQKITKVVKPSAIKEAVKVIPKITKPKLAKPIERGFLETIKAMDPKIPIKIGSQYIPRSTDDLAIKARTLINEHLEVAEELVRTGVDEKSVATASELIKHYSDEASKATSKAIKDALYDKASKVAHITATNLTEQGRSIQAASIMGRLTPEGMLRFAAREINKYNELIEKSSGIFGLKKKLPKLTAQQTDEILKQFKNIEKMEDGTPKSMAFKRLTDMISDMTPSSMFDKLIAVWKAGLLTGIKTSGLNTFSNLFHGTSEVIKDIPGVVVDKFASIFTGKRTIGLTGKLSKKSVEEGARKGWRYLKTGYDERNVGVKLDWKKVNFGNSKFAKAVQTYEEKIFFLMGAEDQPFYYAAKARSLQSQAIAQAVNKGLKGKKAKTFIDDLVSNPTDKMIGFAANDAEIAVFQNRTLLGKAAKTIQKSKVGELIVPFGRTPSAVAMQFVNYGPVGIIKGIVENIGKGKFSQRAFSQAMGRGITGTGVMFLGAELFKKGMVNLSYPKTERERKLWEVEGRKANSIKVGNKYRGVNVLGPAGFVLLAGAEFQRALEEFGSPFEALLNSTAAGVKSLSEQTFLQGINQVISALNDPNRFGKSFVPSLLSSVVPTIVGDLAKSLDDVQRRTPELLDKLKAKIPIVREELEPRVDVLGKEIARGVTWWESMIDPSRPSVGFSTPVIDELRRMTDAGFDMAPTQVGDKEGFKALTPEENTMMWIKVGELIESKLKSLFELNQYKNAPEDIKADIIKEVIEKAKVNARAQVVLELTDDLEGSALKTKLGELKEGGLMTRTIFNKFLQFSQ